MNVHYQRSTVRVLGVPVITMTRESFGTDANAPTTPASAMVPSPQLTEHGVAYQCPSCGELLLQGLRERLVSTDEQTLMAHHICKENTP
ncbi:hypothetical protein ACFWVM_29395 [Nocardia fluminea]|uniref:hypothetical protein n=1 Tax=Nocardia fluminea TaxID=134984 RepID=UPI00364FE597